MVAENRGTSREAESSEEQQLEVTDLMKQLEQREEALKQARISMDTLTAELEELDRQNQEATQVCVVLRPSLLSAPPHISSDPNFLNHSVLPSSLLHSRATVMRHYSLHFNYSSNSVF